MARFRSPVSRDADGAVIVDETPDIPGAEPEPGEETSSAPSAPSAEPTMGDLLKALTLAVQANALTPEKIGMLAQAMQRSAAVSGAMGGPVYEQAQSDYKSVFNPRGELDFPRDELEREYYWLGYRISGTTETQTEIRLLNLLKPGNYDIENLAGQAIPFSVIGMDKLADPKRLLIMFPNTDDDARAQLPSMSSMLYQVVEQYAPPNIVQAVRAEEQELDSLRRGLRTKRRHRREAVAAL